MANSRLRRLGTDSFLLPIRTPGPLGHNDAASPDFPNILGDTPGSLGINDYADPTIPENNRDVEVFRNNLRRQPSLMKISQDGLLFIWNEEFVKGISERLHWPGGASGVTLGAGYDMKGRSKDAVTRDFISIGINGDKAKQAAQGAGLMGQDANQFVRDNRKLLLIDRSQATALLSLIIPGYEGSVRREVNVAILQHEYDALVSFAYNPGGRFRKVARLINQGSVSEAMRQIKAANTSGGRVLTGLVHRRNHEVNLYLKGDYRK